MSRPVGALSGSGIVHPVGSSKATDAASTVYFHGEKNRTWLHWRIDAPTATPDSRTSGLSPRASKCAAAARPTGPAPMTATGSVLREVFIDQCTPWDRLAAGETVEQPLQGGDNGLFVEAVVHLAAVLANADQSGAAEDVQVVRNGWSTERDAVGDVADVELRPGEDLDQVLTHRIR